VRAFCSRPVVTCRGRPQPPHAPNTLEPPSIETRRLCSRGVGGHRPPDGSVPSDWSLRPLRPVRMGSYGRKINSGFGGCGEVFEAVPSGRVPTTADQQPEDERHENRCREDGYDHSDSQGSGDRSSYAPSSIATGTPSQALRPAHRGRPLAFRLGKRTPARRAPARRGTVRPPSQPLSVGSGPGEGVDTSPGPLRTNLRTQTPKPVRDFS
jgi:hypothetical protein